MAELGAHPAGNSSARSAIAFNMSVIVLAAALVGLGFAYFLDIARSSAPGGPSLETVDVVVDKSIAGRRLAIPQGWFRFSDQRISGFSEKIDLTFMLPLGPQGSLSAVNATLMPRSRVRPSDRLLDSVYLHQFEQSQIDGPLGLIGKPLKQIDGFQNETVWYDPVSQTPFVAKCTPLIEDPTHSSCMRTILVTDQIAATFVFDANVLERWKNFDVEAQRWLSRIGGI